jgi:hypothetical protein
VPTRAVSTTLAALLLGAALITGCSDDEGGGDDSAAPEAAPYVEALRQSFTTQQPGELFYRYSDAEATCIAERTMDAFGLDFFVDNDITAAELASVGNIVELEAPISEEQAEAAAAAVTDCDVDYGSYYTHGTGSDTVKACINEGVDPEVIADAGTSQYLGEPEAAFNILLPVMVVLGDCVAAG